MEYLTGYERSICWQHAREIPEVEITMQEIAEKFNVDVDKIKIK